MMDSVDVRFRFERYEPVVRSSLARVATRMGQLIQEAPHTLSHFSFARASHVASGTFGAGIAGEDVPIRLRAIECGGRALLELGYDAANRLATATYTDGARLSYRYDGIGTLVGVDLGTHGKIQFTPSRFGVPAAAAYPDGSTFTRRFTPLGALREIVYPDRGAVLFEHDQAERLVSSRHGDASFEYERDAKGNLVASTFRRGGSAWRLEEPAGRGQMHLHTHSAPRPAGGVVLSHAIGSWEFLTDGRIEEMFLLGGERRCLRVWPSAQRVTAWSDAGLSEWLFDAEGALTASIDPEGARTMYWKVPHSERVLAVKPTGSVLLEYDGRGRLHKTRETNGSFSINQYDRRGALSQITTEHNWLRLAHTPGGWLTRVTSSSGLVVDLPRPSGESSMALSTPGWPGVMELSDVVWRERALRPGLGLGRAN